jgi:hypothetical protein
MDSFEVILDVRCANKSLVSFQLNMEFFTVLSYAINIFLIFLFSRSVFPDAL